MAEPAPFSNLQTPEQIALNRKLGQQLMMQGMSVDPVGHWTQGLGRVLQAGVGRMHMSDADNQQQMRNEAMMGALQRSPTFAGLSPDDRAMMGMDPDMMRAVLPKVYAEKLDPTAGLRRNMLVEQIKAAEQARLHAGQMNPEQLNLLRAQIKALEQKDALDQFIAQNFGVAQPQQPAPSPVRPQSYSAPPVERPAIMQPVVDGAQPPTGDPLLIPTQAGPQQRPQAQPQPADDPIVDTPAGRMPASKARQLGFLLAYKGKGEAGKMIAEPANPEKLSKEARDKIDKNEIDLTDQLGRLAQIKRAFRPDFLSIEEQAKQYGVSWLDKFDATRSAMPPEMLQKHAEYQAFKRDVTANLNLYIKEITGAAMGVQEAQRIISSMPNMDDGPAAFRSKLDATVRAAQLAVARTRYLRTEGFKGQPWQGTPEQAASALPLERMGAIIRDDTRSLLQQLKTQFPNAADEQIHGAVRAEMRRKYGIDA